MKHLIMIAALAISLFSLDNVKPIELKKLPLSEPTQIEKFLDRIASIETPGGGYHTVNKFGMMGRYQFSPEAVRAVGLRVSRQQFLKNPELQDTAMVRLMHYNQNELQHYIEKYDGRNFKGIRITRAAILAGAHFAGAGGVKAFFSNTSRTGTRDAFGTTLRKYMAEFSNFHLPVVVL